MRVSFDDENTTAMGRAASPAEADSSPIIPASPQSARRPWYSNIGRNKKKDFVPLEDDEVMQPRPALPSFGSVREKKKQQQQQQQPKDLAEERPLVRPNDVSHSPPMPSSPTMMLPIASAGEERSVSETLGPSSDHALGSLINQDQASRTAANISRFREPLPPVVTSLEGSGYVSDSSSSSEDESGLIADTPIPEAPTPVTQEAQEDRYGEERRHEEPAAAAQREEPAEEGDEDDRDAAEAIIPAIISISQPGPVAERDIPEEEVFDVPGGFPEEEPEESPQHEKTEAQELVMPETFATPVRRVTLEPVAPKAEEEDAMMSASTPTTVAVTHLTIPEESGESSSDGSSIYSDAYEDLSEMEGDGFMSLDAVVHSPITTSSSKDVSPLAQPRAAANAAQKEPESPLARTDSPGPPVLPVSDWETAKAYWRSLTAEKRAQLEEEAMEDAGAEGDLEASRQATKKATKKKKMVKKKKKVGGKRTAEQKATQQIATHPERVYMIQPGTRVGESGMVVPPMRASLRREQQPEEAGGQARMRKSMRTSDS
ncbi:MAG: hypothetical protein OK454_01845, partial [Thaumarchaeota archaeon]|nr:hypothetical protein [Nitrososphaerota archaeon]